MTIPNEIIKTIGTEYTVQYTKEVARGLIKRGFLMSKDITEFGIINYALNYLEIERTANADIYITDRSVIDLCSYILTNKSKKIRQPYISIIEEILYLESQLFDLYLYIPVEIPFEFDGVRPEDLEYRDEVAKTMINILNKRELNYLEVRGSVEERKNIAIDAVKRLLSMPDGIQYQ